MTMTMPEDHLCWRNRLKKSDEMKLFLILKHCNTDPWCFYKKTID